MAERQGNKFRKILRARELRKESTKAETALWQFLRDRFLFSKKFRRQHRFHGFILDFYCPEEKLAIELDGPIHLKQKAYDLARQKIIEKHGLKLIRFNNDEVFNDLGNILEKIKLNFSRPSLRLRRREGGRLRGSG